MLKFSFQSLILLGLSLGTLGCEGDKPKPQSPNPSKKSAASGANKPSIVQRYFVSLKISRSKEEQTTIIRRINNLKAEVVLAEMGIVLQALKEDSKLLRLMAVNVLRRLGDKAKNQKMFLQDAMKDGDRYVRTTAAQALLEMGEDRVAATRVIIQAIKEEPTGEFKVTAAKPLMKEALKAKDIIPYLKTELNADNADIRLLVLTLLVSYGPETAREIKNSLEVLKGDSNLRISTLANETLKQLKKS
jgi:hypothetical protein